MTVLNARTESFVTLLLEVSGRARPSDMQGVSAEEATEILQAYAAAHAAEGVRLEGDTLVVGTAQVQPSAPAPTPATESAQKGVQVQEQPASWMFDGEVPAAPTDDAGMFEGLPAPVLSTPLDAVPASVPDDAPIARDFIDLPPLEDAEDASVIQPERKATSPLLIVLLVLLLVVVGAAAAYYLGALEMLGLSIG